MEKSSGGPTRQHIDDYKEIQDALMESETRFNRVLEYLDSEILIYTIDPQSRAITYVSPSVEKILGYTPAEFIRPVAEHWTSNPINEDAKHKSRLSTQGVRQAPYRMELYHQDGTSRLMESTDFPVFGNYGDIIRVECIVRDITEINKAEDKLAQAQKSYETSIKKAQKDITTYQEQYLEAIDFSNDPVYAIDSDGKISVWNSAMESMSGVSRKTAVGADYKAIVNDIYKDDKPLLIDLLEANLKTVNLKGDKISENNGRLSVDRYLPRINKGAGGYVRISARFLKDREGKKLGAIESIHDIGEYSPVVNPDQQQDKQLSSVVRNLPGAAFRLIKDRDWNFSYISQGCDWLTGYEPSYFENININVFFNLIQEKDLNDVKQKFEDTITTGQPLSIDYRLKTRNGETRHVYTYACLSENAENESCIDGYIVDFSAYKPVSAEQSDNTKPADIPKKHHKFGNIIGNSREMKEVYELIAKAAGTTDSVFISGESGTGKELVSQAIHNASDRSVRNCVTVNCGAIPESLIESEFFGYQKGAFTGATTDKKGFLEVADGGTLFLDEIGEISLNMQVKLLRAIEGGGFSPIGSRRVIRPNLRIIAASNVDPIDLVKQGKMRSDFYFRIHVIPIHIPPLRERGNDIRLLIDHFLDTYQTGEKRIGLTSEELRVLNKYQWPGNVRELQNVMRRYIALRNLDFMDIGPIIDEASSDPAPGEETGNILANAVDNFEKKFITQFLKKNRWKKGETAKALSISRKTLFRKMKRHDML